jgi:hypothetical protein
VNEDELNGGINIQLARIELVIKANRPGPSPPSKTANVTAGKKVRKGSPASVGAIANLIDNAPMMSAKAIE